jgi:biopolymer transport protein ExbD
MARKTRRQKLKDEVSKEAKTDMTPMIDVVFLLIIFFLCIDFKVLEAKLAAYLPKDKGSLDTPVEPQEQLRIKITLDKPGEKVPRPGSSNAFMLKGHRVTYMVGPQKVETLEEMKKKLEEIYKDPNRKVPDPVNKGQMKVMDVVVEPGTGAVYGDVAPCVDTIAAVGFKEINFGGGLGSTATGAYADKRKGK